MKFLLEHVDCDLCGGSRYRLRYRKPDDWLWGSQHEFPVVECEECGLVFVNPRPTAESMGPFYPEGYHDDRRGPEWAERYARELDYLDGLSPRCWLDVGCARGDFLLRARERYHDAELHGVDPYSEGVRDEALRDEGFFFHPCSLPECEFDDGQFDVVTAWAVFEHLHHPSRYFRELARVLAPGGRFFLLVTNSESLWSRRAYLEDVPRHTYHYSEATLRAYARRFGFGVERVVYDDRIWDGRGRRVFRYLLEALAGVTWETRFFGERNLAQRAAARLGRWFDRLVFHFHWEAALRRSGTLVAELSRPSSPS